jgi:hypothetical protein
MSRRKAALSQARLRRQWPHRVAISGDKMRGNKNYDIVYSFSEAFSVAPLTYSLRRDDGDYVVFYFAKPEDAQAFCDRFEGERLTEATKVR